MTNKILMVGVLDVPSSTNVFMAKGFEQLGYEVDVYNYRTKLRELGFEGMHKDLEHKVILNNAKYKLIVFCKTNQVQPQMLDILKKGGPTWYWFMDNLKVAKSIFAASYALSATFASATASDVVDRFKEVNKKVYHIIEGYNPDTYYYENIKKIHDVLFIGNATMQRIVAINDLREAGVDVTIFGQGWPSGMLPNAPVWAKDERTEINQSKVVLNLCHDDIIFSDRIVKSLGCGARVISQPCKDLLNSDIGVHVDLFNTTDNFKQVRESGFPTSPPVALASHIKGNYSWESVCHDILEKVEADEH